MGMPGHLAAHDPPSDALLRFAQSCSFAALSRRPSLRSARGCATRQASPAVSLSLKRQASPAARTLPRLTSGLSSKKLREPVGAASN